MRLLLRSSPTLALVANRAVLAVEGSDATRFLNGLLSVTVQHRPAYAALLHAQGRVLHDVFLFTGPSSSYFIEHDSSSPLLPLLKRFVLRSKVRIRDVTDEWDLWAAWGEPAHEPQRSWLHAASGAVEPVWHDHPWGTDPCVILDRRAPGMGRRLLVRKGDRPHAAATHDVLPSDAYLLHRILHGVPEGSNDIQPLHAFPIESNLDVMGGLDFRKGCYVGQELTVRTYHTGVIRKRILPVALSTTSPSPGPGPSLHLPIKPTVIPQGDAPAPRLRGSSVLLTSIATPSMGPGTAVGLALLRLEHLRKDVALFTDAEGWKVDPWWPDWWPQNLDSVD